MEDDGLTASAYNDTHRAFLQALLSRQSIDYESAKPLIAAIKTAAEPDRPTLPGDVTKVEFQEYINAVSNQLTPFDFEIRDSKDQKNGGDQVWALVNTTSDAMTQMATVHTADEIAFTKRVLDRMFDENNTPGAEIMAVKSMDAVNLRKAGGRRDSGQTQEVAAGNAADITMQQAERMLKSLVEEGWFNLSEDETWYSLSQRGLMELRQWLEATYNDHDDEEERGEEDDEYVHKRIKTCSACKDIITIGQRCPRLKCDGRLHDHCTGNMWRKQGQQAKKCPVCKTPWENPPPVGEKAARGQNGRRSTNGRRSSTSTNGRRSQRAATNGADSDGSEDLYA